MPRPASALTAFLVLTTMWGCSGGGGSPTSPTEQAGPPSFTVAPIDPATLQYIVPLGNMGPWAHTLPTDHAYFYHHLQSGTFVPVPVLAPGIWAGCLSPARDGRAWRTCGHAATRPGRCGAARAASTPHRGGARAARLDCVVQRGCGHLRPLNRPLRARIISTGWPHRNDAARGPPLRGSDGVCPVIATTWRLVSTWRQACD